MLSTVRLEQRGAVQFCARLGRSPSETHTLLKSAYQQDTMRKAATRTYHRRFKTIGTDVYNTFPKVKKTRTRQLKKSIKVVEDNTDLVNYIISQQANRDIGSDGQSEIDSLGTDDTFTSDSFTDAGDCENESTVNSESLGTDDTFTSDSFTDVGDCENESTVNSENFTDQGDFENNNDSYSDVPDMMLDNEDSSVESLQIKSSTNYNSTDSLMGSNELDKHINKPKENMKVISTFKNNNSHRNSKPKEKKAKCNAHGFYVKLNGETWKIKSYEVYN